MTREEVLTALALEIHSNGTGRCTGCPLRDDPTCTVTLAREALKLLKAQEPRVIALKEVLASEVVYAEDVDKRS